MPGLLRFAAMKRTRRIARRIARGAALLAVCGLAVLSVGFDHALYRHDVVQCGTREGSAIALTFDDGPDPVHTPEILDALAIAGARATFFVVGEHAERHPELIGRMLREGHEVAHHTHTHPYVGEVAPEILAAEFEDAYATLESLGAQPLWYRPPRKELSFEQKRLAREHGMRVVLWTRTLERARFDSADEMSSTLIKETCAGDILLAHDGRLDRSMTVEALPALLAGLGERGLEVVTVSELLCGE